jgi:tRNA modification GTPase
MELTKREIAEADLLLLVFDAGRPWTAVDQAFLDKHPRSLVIHNKVDLAHRDHHRPTGVFVSATTGEGIEALPKRIADHLVPAPPPPGAAVPFTEEQIAKLRSLVVIE